MRLNMQDKCWYRYNKATTKVGGRVIFSASRLRLLTEESCKSRFPSEISVHFCQAAYALVLHSLCVCQPSSSVTQQSAISSPLHGLIILIFLHGAAVLCLFLLKLNVPYGFHFQKGLSCTAGLPSCLRRAAAAASQLVLWYLSAVVRVVGPNPKNLLLETYILHWVRGQVKRS